MRGTVGQQRAARPLHASAWRSKGRCSVVVGVCRLSLYFPESGSLKTKRQGLRKIIDRLRAKFNAAVAEVADQDTWQRATVGITVVGNEGPHVQSMIDHITSFVEEMYVAQILDRQQELLTYSDREGLGEESAPAFPFPESGLGRPAPRSRPRPRGRSR